MEINARRPRPCYKSIGYHGRVALGSLAGDGAVTDDGLELVRRPQRLRSLADYRILGSEPEDAFDDACALARQLCGTEAALISFVDQDRQWFKARIGFDRSETDLERSVCRHALGMPDLLVIDDLARDRRTADNPLVTGHPFLRFYAGAPIHGETGECLGALCVLDAAPRPGGLSADEAEGLARLARQVERLLALRRRADEQDAALALVVADAAPDRERQQLVAQELGHRFKNLLTVVQAIASQTLRQSPDRGSLDTFDARIQALGGAQDVLLRQDGAGAGLADVVATVLAPFGLQGRILCDGPPVALGARAVLNVSLVLHELATNALKYGALSDPAGRVRLEWRVEDGRLVVDWTEEDGPPAAEPTRRGFGSKLLGTGLAGTGGAELRYRPEGFSATLSAGLADLGRN